MNNYQDIEEIKDFIEGMTHSIERGTQEMIDEGKNIPDVVLYLIKKPNNEGGANYGVGGGAVPSDEIGKILHNKIVPLVIQKEGHTILCKMESVFSNGVMKVEFTNKLTDEVSFEEFNYNKPYQVSDLMSNICLN